MPVAPVPLRTQPAGLLSASASSSQTCSRTGGSKSWTNRHFQTCSHTELTYIHQLFTAAKGQLVFSLNIHKSRKRPNEKHRSIEVAPFTVVS